MEIKIQRTFNEPLIHSLHGECFPTDAFTECEKNYYWVAMDGRMPAGFSIASDIGYGILFLSRTGVVAEYRGNGIHRRFISTRIRFGRDNGYRSIITYTQRLNSISANNLIRSGFETYNPEWDYAGDNFVYWILEL